MDSKIYLPLLNIFEGYVRNYRRLNLFQNQNKSMFTKREIEYFANVGEYLGFFSYVEDTKPNYDYGRSRPMDLAWWKWDERISDTEFSRLVLHLERESFYSKDYETIEKLFCMTDSAYEPDNAIGMLNVELPDRIETLENEVIKRNRKQKSEVLMIYKYHDDEQDLDRIMAHFNSEKFQQYGCRKAISTVDETGYWMMCFDEEYKIYSN